MSEVIHPTCRAVYNVYRNHQAIYGYNPSIREVAANVGIVHSRVTDWVQWLCEHGYMARPYKHSGRGVQIIRALPDTPVLRVSQYGVERVYREQENEQ